jgi:threonine/homoserine/homoserine lactone efflux protein
MKSFLVAATNPKGYLFCSALLPQFIDPQAAQAPQYVVIAIVFAGLDFLVMLAYAVTGARAIRMFNASAVKWFDRACGGTLLALAGSLAFYRRANA